MGIVIDAEVRFNARRRLAEQEREAAYRNSPEAQERARMLLEKLKQSFDEHPGDPT
jgi:hypothetical protein